MKRALFDFYNPNQIAFDGESVTDLDGYRPHTAMTVDIAAQYSSYFKFSVVRNPWSWHASIWKFFQRPDRNNKIITGASFEAYLEEVCRTDSRLPYRRNQADWICDGDSILVDFVCRFERLREEFDTIAEKLGLPRAMVSLPHYKNAGPYDYRTMYTDKMTEMVATKHERDIRLFDYSFDGDSWN